MKREASRMIHTRTRVRWEMVWLYLFTGAVFTLLGMVDPLTPGWVRVVLVAGPLWKVWKIFR